MSDRSTQAVSQVLDNSSGLSNTVVTDVSKGFSRGRWRGLRDIPGSSPYTGDVQTLRCGYTDGLPNACTMSSEETTDIKHKDKLAIRRVY